MDMGLKGAFLERWEKYFAGAELPITFFYADDPRGMGVVKPQSEHECVIARLAAARKGRPVCFSADSVACFGGKRYFGFYSEIMPGFEYFLSCGIPGKLEGERYKKSPEIVKELMKIMPDLKAPGKYIIFKRWDILEEADEPDVAIFFARPDVLSGLFTLAGFDSAAPLAILAPFAAGCGSIVLWPYLEKDNNPQKCILGMFDVSARPCVPRDTLTFAVPMRKMASMVADMDESFLITPSWDKVRKRLAGG